MYTNNLDFAVCAKHILAHFTVQLRQYTDTVGKKTRENILTSNISLQSKDDVVKTCINTGISPHR